jgi:hypothetical protein
VAKKINPAFTESATMQKLIPIREVTFPTVSVELLRKKNTNKSIAITPKIAAIVRFSQ